MTHFDLSSTMLTLVTAVWLGLAVYYARREAKAIAPRPMPCTHFACLFDGCATCCSCGAKLCTSHAHDARPVRPRDRLRGGLVSFHLRFADALVKEMPALKSRRDEIAALSHKYDNYPIEHAAAKIVAAVAKMLLES